MAVTEPLFVAESEALISAIAALREAGGAPPDPAVFARPGEPEQAGQIRVPVPLVHPRLRAAIARTLGLTEAAVGRIARHDTCLVDGRESTSEELAALEWDVIRATGGGLALADALAARGARGLMVDVVPVIPPSQRTLVQPAGGQVVPGPANRVYREFFDWLRSYEYYAGLNAPPSLCMAAWERVQDGFDRLCAVLAGAPDPRSAWYELDDEWLGQRADWWARATQRLDSLPDIRARLERQLRPTPPYRLTSQWFYPDPLLPLGAAFTGPDRLLLWLAYSVVHLDLATGELLFVAQAPEAHVVGVTPDGDRAVFARGGDHLPEVHVLDLAEGRWVEAWGDLAVRLPIQLYKSGTWTIYELPRRRARTFAELGDRTDQSVLLSPGMQYAWLVDDPGLGIFDVDTLQTHYDARGLVGVPPPRSPGWSLEELEAEDERYEADEETDEDEDEDGPNDVFDPDGEEPDDSRRAFTLTSDGEFRVFYRGTLFAGRTPRFHVDEPCSMAAIDAAGRRLVLGRCGELTLVELAADGSRVGEWALSFEELDEVTLRGAPGLTPALGRALLATFGTRARVAAATEEELAEVAAVARVPVAELVALVRAVREAS